MSKEEGDKESLLVSQYGLNKEMIAAVFVNSATLPATVVDGNCSCHEHVFVK